MVCSLEQLRERATPWAAPISPDAPAGASARSDDDYETVLRQMEQFGTPRSVDIDWAQVVDAGGRLLQLKSKDLKIAAYVCYGLYVTRGAEGLATGLTLCAELLERYWSSLFPELARMQARVNALVWLVDSLTDSLKASVATVPPEQAEAVLVALEWLGDLSGRLLGAQSPKFMPLRDQIERLRAPVKATSTQAATAEASTPVAAQTVAPATAAAPATVGVPSPAPAPEIQAPPPPAASADPAIFLGAMGKSLIDAAVTFRGNDPSEPQAYRVLRVGLWLHLAQPPAVKAGKTTLPPLQPAFRATLEQLATHSKWMALLDECESTLPRHRFALDLQRYSAKALAAQGAPYRAAREALIQEVAALLRRMPTLVELTASDGSPLASPETRAWIDTEVLPPAPIPSALASPAPSEPRGDEEALALNEARARAREGNVTGAIELLQARVRSADSGRARYLAGLALARLCAEAGQPALALGLYEALETEGEERQLDAWEPALSVACLSGLLGLGGAASGAGGTAPASPALWRRLIRLDPVAALQKQSNSRK
jgi:type VI secretion system protein VasJ